MSLPFPFCSLFTRELRRSVDVPRGLFIRVIVFCVPLFFAVPLQPTSYILSLLLVAALPLIRPNELRAPRLKVRPGASPSQSLRLQRRPLRNCKGNNQTKRHKKRGKSRRATRESSEFSAKPSKSSEKTPGENCTW